MPMRPFRHFSRWSRFWILLVSLFACERKSADAGSPAAQVDPAVLELVESWPLETDLDSPGIVDAHECWPRMIDGARQTLDVAQFYVSSTPGGRLEPVIAALGRAAGRKVRVRLLVDAKFHEKYPEPVDSLGRVPGVEVRRLDLRPRGGVMHAKYFEPGAAELSHEDRRRRKVDGPRRRPAPGGRPKGARANPGLVLGRA